MAKLCSDGCYAICDFCKHYHDEYEDKETGFAGEGKCDIDNSLVYADGACDNFECFRLE